MHNAHSMECLEVKRYLAQFFLRQCLRIFVSRYVTRTIEQAVISIQTRCTQLSNNVFTPVTSVTIMPRLTNTSNE